MLYPVELRVRLGYSGGSLSRPIPFSGYGRLSAMAVRTANLTFRNLGRDRIPGVVTEHRPDILALAPADVVEFQAHDIGFTAIHAGV
jgi:hypothetical protein